VFSERKKSRTSHYEKLADAVSVIEAEQPRNVRTHASQTQRRKTERWIDRSAEKKEKIVTS